MERSNGKSSVRLWKILEFWFCFLLLMLMKRLRILRPCEKLVPSLHVLDETMKRSSCFITEYNIGVVVLFSANSLVNHIIYSLRTPGFREGLLQLVCRVPDLFSISPQQTCLFVTLGERRLMVGKQLMKFVF